MGLLYGVVQMLEMGKIGGKFVFRMLRAIAGRIFRVRNLTAALKFVLRVIMGGRLNRDASNATQFNLMEKAWKSLGGAQKLGSSSRSSRLTGLLIAASLLLANLLLVRFTKKKKQELVALEKRMMDEEMRQALERQQPLSVEEVIESNDNINQLMNSAYFGQS